MGLEIEPDQGRQEEDEMTDGYTLTERLYKTEDGEIVREGDPRALTLYKGVGKKISFEEAGAIGLTGDGAAGTDTAAETDDLSKLKRDQLDDLATELGIEDADKLDSKADVIAAIETARKGQ